MRITAVSTTVASERKPRLLGFARALRLAGHDVSIIVTSDYSQGGRRATHDGLAALNRLGVNVVQVPFTLGMRDLMRAGSAVALRRSSSETAIYAARRLSIESARAVETTRPDVVHVDRIRALTLVGDVAAPVVVDVTDPRSAAYRYYRRAAHLSPLRVGIAELVRARIDTGPARREESLLVRGVPILVASELGREALVKGGAESELVTPVPNAVFADERVDPLRASVAGPPLVGMSGNLAYPPNILAVRTLACELLPALRGELDARVFVAGSSPHPLVVRTLTRASIALYRDVSSIPETIRRLRAAVMVSPQRVSAGFPNRVTDAVYRAGIPIVVSAETARSAPPALAEHLPTAHTAEAWVAEARKLLAPAARDDVVEGLQQAIDNTCGPETVVRTLTAAYSRALALPRPCVEELQPDGHLEHGVLTPVAGGGAWQ